jgi:tetratricopeptide (TPR) repeat protein
MNAITGNWGEMLDAQKTILALLPGEFRGSGLHAKIIGRSNIAWAWAGRYADGTRNAREALKIKKRIGDNHRRVIYSALVFLLGAQGMYTQAQSAFEDAKNNSREVYGEEAVSGLGFLGKILLRQGELQRAQSILKTSLKGKKSRNDLIGMPELYVWLGESYELSSEWEKAEESYFDAINMQETGRTYFRCGALSGLARVKYAQGDMIAMQTIWNEARTLCHQYRYYDHLASLYLTQGHALLDQTLGKEAESTSQILEAYQLAMTFALNFNRFLLDETLWGGAVTTPLKPIIPTCLGHRDLGRAILEALREWWQVGTNRYKLGQSDMLSPLPVGVSLLDAESTARILEHGDGSKQFTVTEKLDAALD